MAVKPLPLGEVRPPHTWESPRAPDGSPLPPLVTVWAQMATASAAETGLRSAGSLKEYRVDGNKVIGKGGDSAILLATHEKLGNVALKITEKQGRRPEQIGRARFEAHILTERIRHPNIVKAHDWMETADHVVVVLEHAPFGDLLDLLNLRKGFSESEASKIVTQLAYGLDYAHERGIVHGDVKLENILLYRATADEQTRFGMKHRVTICDWGFARPAGQVLVRSFGSVYYTAPEVLAAAGELTPAADMWGLGIVLYALLCACLPFQSDNLQALRTSITNAQYTYPRGYTISDHAKDLIARLLSVNPKDRPTAKTLLAHPWFSSSLSTASPRKGAASQTADAH